MVYSLIGLGDNRHIIAQIGDEKVLVDSKKFKKTEDIKEYVKYMLESSKKYKVVA